EGKRVNRHGLFRKCFCRFPGLHVPQENLHRLGFLAFLSDSAGGCKELPIPREGQDGDWCLVALQIPQKLPPFHVPELWGLVLTAAHEGLAVRREAGPGDALLASRAQRAVALEIPLRGARPAVEETDHAVLVAGRQQLSVDGEREAMYAVAAAF